MRIALLAFSALLMAAASATAQDATTAQTNSNDQPVSQSMAQLLTENYEIKAAVPNGSRFIVFMQKDQSAYACEFASLTSSRCGAIK